LINMPYIRAFRGIRYDLGHVGSLGDVVAPPYDVIDTELQDRLYANHAANSVRLILGRNDPEDDQVHNRYTRAAKLLRKWQREGLLFTESDPALYVYHQRFEVAGKSFTRRGFMCRTRLERFGEGDIHPHEQTHGGAKADRLKLWNATRTNLSQIFGLYPDADNEVQQLLEQAILGQTPLEATDHLGVIHQLWPVTNVGVITAVTGKMGGLPIFIADGHHRYETACDYRDQLAAEMAKKQQGTEQEGAPFPPEHPANFVLMMCVSIGDPGLLVLPTHRLFRGIAPISAAELTDRLGDSFEVESAGTGPERAFQVWEEIEMEGEQGTLGLYTAKDKRWLLARITESGRQKMAQVAGDHSPDWQGLGVSLLHRLVIDTLLADVMLNGPSLPAPKYVRSIEEVTESLTGGDIAGRDLTGQISTGGHFELAALVMPATLEHIRRISGHGERMPAKSTYFYPKLLSGLVFNPLE
jgi:uncharacterized protein (DUF1015 family)